MKCITTIIVFFLTLLFSSCNELAGVQFARIQSSVKVKAFLAGAYDSGTGLMRTTLNDNDYLPTSHPYTDSFFNHNGLESVHPNFFDEHPEIVDWILLEVRSDLARNTKLASKAVFIDENGELRDLDSSDTVTSRNLPSGDYYIVLRHRNHLGVISADKVSFDEFTPGEADLTSSVASVQDCAGGIVCLSDLTGGFFGLIGGDGNLDGEVDSQDPGDAAAVRETVLADPLNLTASVGFSSQGYQVSDYNLSGDSSFIGGSSDYNIVFFGVLTHPDNTSFDLNYIIEDNENI